MITIVTEIHHFMFIPSGLSVRRKPITPMIFCWCIGTTQNNAFTGKFSCLAFAALYVSASGCISCFPSRFTDHRCGFFSPWGYLIQGFSRFSVVAASAAQNAAQVVQAGTKDITSKVEFIPRLGEQFPFCFLRVAGDDFTSCRSLT